MPDDALLTPNDIEEALSVAYAAAVSAAAGYVVALKNFDRDGIDITFEAGGNFRPKIDAQLKATVNLPLVDGIYRYECKVRNYDLLRIPTQTPRILIVLHLPRDREEWISITAQELILRKCAFWMSLAAYPESRNEISVTIEIPERNQFDAKDLCSLMEQSRNGRIG